MPLSKQAKVRIGTLVRFMESLPRSASKHFNMGVWFMHKGRHSHDGLQPGQVISRTALSQCGTSACALGWAATIPSFKKAGLQTIVTDGIGTVRYEDCDGSIESACKFFDIDRSMATRLFYCEAGTPKQWAKEARRVMKAPAAA